MQSSARWIQTFNRIFNRHLMSASVLVLIFFLLAGNIRVPGNILRDPDLWWHLADARILATTHHFIHTEPYSFTVAGKPWVDPEWLSEEFYWQGFQHVGLAGIYVVALLALFANILFVYWRAVKRSGHAGAAFWASVIGIALMIVNAGPRTIVIAYLAMSAEMALLEAAERGHKRLLWLLPPLFIVWINLHGTWIIGICILVLYILSGFFSFRKGVFEQDGFSADYRNLLLLVLLASVLVTIINPYGWRLVWNPLDMMFNQKLNIANIQEWQPLNFHMVSGIGALIAIMLSVIANSLRGRKWKVFDLAIVLFAWFSAFDHARFAFMAAVLVVPLLAMDFQTAFCTESDEKTIPVFNMILVLSALGAIIYYYPAEAKLQKEMTHNFPMQTIRSIQPSWRTLNNDGLGGIMDFESRPTFIDSRIDTFEHHGVLKDYLDIVQFRNSLALMDKYHVDHALLQENQALSYLLHHTPGWTVVRSEGTGDLAYTLFVRTPGTPVCAPAATAR
ncbi:MAG TPA: hypothetical protein VMV57_03620 [Terracidiphilus sp.]|nr:hypothetical protein [Terracidiphilus sp.]